MQRRWLLTLGGLALLLTWKNASCLAPRRASPRLIAHRGVHQTFTMEGIEGDTCTAARIDPVTHPYLENTIPSMAAAFEAGASLVELDVHATSDGQLAVFHDATLECRTEGQGAPEEHTLAELRGLDLGYGYTADGGRTWPLRGTGVGMLVTLPEVLERFPDRSFLIHIKTDRPEDGEAVADALAALPAKARLRQIVYGGERAVARVTARWPEVRSFDKGRLKRCLGGYLALGWAGYMPEACNYTLVLVPTPYARLLWGFPRRFEARLSAVWSEAALVGELEGGFIAGVDDADALARVPEDYAGWIWTNKVEVLGPLLGAAR